jgi:hypothetical protein
MQKIINQLSQTSTFEEEAPLDKISDCFVLGMELARDCSPLEGAACEPVYIKLTEVKID